MSMLVIDRGAVASGLEVENQGFITNNGLLSSGSSVINRGMIVNSGTISAYNLFSNQGTISGTGMVFVDGSNGVFDNVGMIAGGIAINGHFQNYNGNISLQNASDIIRVTNGKATIFGGEIDTNAYTNMEVGTQYLFLITDKPGDLYVQKDLYASGSGTGGSVLDLAPVYGYWDGSKYIAGKEWSINNQYYWLEVQRAYRYGQYAATPNQIAVGEYLDTIGDTVKGSRSNPSALWNLLTQLDAISEQRGYEHQGQVSPEALQALNELSGISYANIGLASVHNVGVVNRSLGDVLRSDVFKFSNIGNPNNAIRGQAIAPLRYTRWGTLFGIGGTSASDGNASGYRQSFGGVMAGVDRALWTGTRIGGWFSAATGDVEMSRVRENTDLTNVMVGMYLRQEMYFGYGLAALGFGVDNYKTKRHLDMLGHRAQSKYNGHIGTAYLERGIDIPVYYATVQPYTSFQVVTVRQENFTETMWDQTGQYAGVGLQGLKASTDSYKLALGARASSVPVPLQWGQVAVTTNLAWFHEFNADNHHNFVARFANPGGSNFEIQNTKFRVHGNNPRQDWFNFGFGLHVDRNSTRFFIGPDLYANNRQTLFSGNGGFVTSW